MALEPRTEHAARAEQQHIDKAGNDRRDREGKIDQRRQERLALELELGDGPCRRHAEDQVERHRDDGHQQRQPDGGQRIGIAESREELLRSLAERLDEHGGQRQQQEKRQEDEGQRHQRVAGGGRLRRGRAQAAGRLMRHDHISCGSMPG